MRAFTGFKPPDEAGGFDIPRSYGVSHFITQIIDTGRLIICQPETQDKIALNKNE